MAYDNSYLFVQQGVDTSKRLQAFDLTDTRQVVGIQPSHSAEIHFRRSRAPDSVIVGKLSSALNDFEMIAENPTDGVEEAIIMTFRGENTETWDLQLDTNELKLSEDGGEVLVGAEILYGTLHVRDAKGIDVPYLSGAHIPLYIEASTTLAFSVPPTDTTDNFDV